MKATSLYACLILSLFAASVLRAAPVYTLDVYALIDGRDQLIITPTTLQWHHFDYAAVGRIDGRDEPTTITSTFDGTPILSSFQWTPTWPNPVPDQIRFETYSSIFSSAQPLTPSEPMTVSMEALSARAGLNIVGLPSEANGFTTIVEFDDNAPAGPAFYEARLTFEPIPEPTVGAIAGISALAWLLVRQLPVRRADVRGFKH